MDVLLRRLFRPFKYDIWSDFKHRTPHYRGVLFCLIREIYIYLSLIVADACPYLNLPYIVAILYSMYLSNKNNIINNTYLQHSDAFVMLVFIRKYPVLYHKRCLYLLTIYHLRSCHCYLLTR